MSDFLARRGLQIYRLMGAALYPFSGPFLRLRARRGKEDRDRRSERYGYASYSRPAGPLIWFHAASVGESLAILPLIKRLESNGITMVLTTGTVTSAEILKDRLSKRTVHQYVPMDMPRAVQRFLDHWKPDLAVFAESELWPTTIDTLTEKRVPLALVNARLSDRSFKRWMKHPNLSGRIFGRLALVVAQSEVDGERYRDLGARRVDVSGNLKLDVGQPVADDTALKTLSEQIGNRPVWLALSTHEGEEESVAVVHRMLAQRLPNVLTVLVPRHTDRRADVEAVLKKHGLSVVNRSSGGAIDDKTNVLLGDTMGEMGLYLGLGHVAFMGKSLKSDGGQNPIEPALADTAILTGRFVQNFRDTYQALLDNGGARLVRDEPMLAQHVLRLLTVPAECVDMRSKAQQTVQGMGGAVDRTYRSLETYVLPMRLQAGLADLNGPVLRAQDDVAVEDTP